MKVEKLATTRKGQLMLNRIYTQNPRSDTVLCPTPGALSTLSARSSSNYYI